MKKMMLISASFLLCSNLAFAQESVSPVAKTPLCLFANTPSVQFKTIKRIKVAKGTYGGVTDLYPRLNQITDKYKANAVINYTASQRFGFWPWRMVRPVGLGTAVQIETPFDCKTLGGTEI